MPHEEKRMGRAGIPVRPTRVGDEERLRIGGMALREAIDALCGHRSAPLRQPSQQERIAGWAEKIFPHATPRTIVTHLYDELDELRNAVWAAVDRGDVDDPKIAEEAADLGNILYHLAARCGFDLLVEIEKKFAINQTRVFGPPDARGVSHHIPEGEREVMDEGDRNLLYPADHLLDPTEQHSYEYGGHIKTTNPPYAADNPHPSDRGNNRGE